MAKVEHVVVDSGGFIKNAPLQAIGNDLVTICDVVAEIRDKTTRQRLQVLPYELKFREPSAESIRIVTEFSKKTGDYANLSAVDLRLLALTYQLEKEHCGTEHIKTEPDRNITWQTSKRNLENPTEIAGFYLQPKKTSSQSRSTSVCENQESSAGVHPRREDTATEREDVGLGEPELNESTNSSGVSVDRLEAASVGSQLELRLQKLNCDSTEGESEINNDTEQQDLGSPEGHYKPTDSTTGTGEGGSEREEVGEGRAAPGCIADGDVLPQSCVLDDVSGDESTESDDEDDDDEGWITPGNINQVKAQMGEINSEEAKVKVGCLTTDFAMQNVLIQMGLNVISVDGMLIKRAKSYVLRCYACFKVSTDTTRQFCKHCGNSTLQRVSMTVNDDGSICYFVSTRRPLSTRGKKFALPLPKGGKYASNPILVEDQREAQQRASGSSRVKYDVMDPDYVTHTSPFAPHDTQSRAAQLGFNNRWGKKRNKGIGERVSKRAGRRR